MGARPQNLSRRRAVRLRIIAEGSLFGEGESKTTN
jgi:hypothetical protein